MSGSRIPFEVPHLWKNKAPRGFKERKVLSFSDGDVRTWPGNDLYRPSDERNYLIQLATDWAKEENQSEPGVAYYLDRLPEGYACFEQHQTSGPQVYKRLFGHPSGRFYDSITKFQVHFQWLMKGMQGSCECVLCFRGNKKPFIPRSRIPREPQEMIDRAQQSERNLSTDVEEEDGSSRSESVEGHSWEQRKRHKRQRQIFPRVDEEGTLDVWEDCFRRLENTEGDDKGIEIDIEEPDSVDWKAERKSLPCYLTQIEQQHSFIPRLGELVLWCPEWPDNYHLCKDPAIDMYKFYSFKQQRFYGCPSWRGGVVASVPTASTQNGSVDFVDLLDTPKKKTSTNVAGFRIETVPDPNDDLCKSSSKQYKYVPLRNIRPLSHWQLLLKGVRQDRLHPSILNALTSVTTISLVEKWRFNGTWPDGTIFAKGIYLGAEFITIGDTVRLTPRTAIKWQQGCTDVLIIESVRYHVKDFRSHQAPLYPLQFHKRSHITLVGQAFTTDIHRAYNMPADEVLLTAEAVQLPSGLRHEDVKTVFRPVGTDQFGPWYRLHSSQQRYEVSYEQVLGRLYEADAVKLWSGQCQLPSVDGRSKQPKVDLNFDTESILAGRRYASQVDARLPEPVNGSNVVNWYLADTRAKALTIASMNGVELSSYHNIRTPATVKSWRAHLKIAEGVKPEGSLMQDIHSETKSKSDEKSIESTGKRRGRPQGSKVVDGRLYLERELLPDVKNMKDITERTQSTSYVTDEYPDERQHSSQMADAALASTDEEDITLEIKESDGGEDQITTSGNRFSLHSEPTPPTQTSQQNVKDLHNTSRAGRITLRRPTPPSSTSESSDRSRDHRSRSSSQQFSNSNRDLEIQTVTETTEERDIGTHHVRTPYTPVANDPMHDALREQHEYSDGDDETHDASDDTENDSDDSDSEVEELRGDEWKTARFARGGTEESEGGDYRPD